MERITFGQQARNISTLTYGQIRKALKNVKYVQLTSKFGEVYCFNAQHVINKSKKPDSEMSRWISWMEVNLQQYITNKIPIQ